MKLIEELSLRLDQIDMYAKHNPIKPEDAAAICAAVSSAKKTLDQITEAISTEIFNRVLEKGWQ